MGNQERVSWVLSKNECSKGRRLEGKGRDRGWDGVTGNNMRRRL